MKKRIVTVEIVARGPGLTPERLKLTTPPLPNEEAMRIHGLLTKATMDIFFPKKNGKAAA